MVTVTVDTGRISHSAHPKPCLPAHAPTLQSWAGEACSGRALLAGYSLRTLESMLVQLSLRIGRITYLRAWFFGGNATAKVQVHARAERVLRLIRSLGLGFRLGSNVNKRLKFTLQPVRVQVGI